MNRFVELKLHHHRHISQRFTIGESMNECVRFVPDKWHFHLCKTKKNQMTAMSHLIDHFSQHDKFTPSTNTLRACLLFA